MKRYITSSTKDTAFDADTDIKVHYLSDNGYFYGPSFTFKPVNISNIVSQFNYVTDDPASKYLVLMYHSTVSGTYYDKAVYCDNYITAKAAALEFLSKGASTASDSIWDDKHYYVNVIDLFNGREIYFNDVFNDSSTSWASSSHV